MFKRKLFGLIIIATGLVTLNMTLLWKLGDIAHFWMSIVFWLAVGSLLWEKQDILKQSEGKSDVLSTVAGTILIAFILFKSAMVSSKFDPFLRIGTFFVGFRFELNCGRFSGFKTILA